MTLEALSQLIAASYGPLIRSSQLRFGECVSDETFAVAAIDVRFDYHRQEVFANRDVMNDTAEGRRVDGASNLQVIASGT